MLYDVAIIGGGPAGSTAATLLARRGRRVVLCEKEPFPRFKIGESLLPHSLHTLDQLGVRAQLDAHAFPKHGGEIATACGRRIKRFYFESALQLRDRTAYQVERAWFDKMLLDHARQQGVELHQPCSVEDVAFDKEGVTLITDSGQLHARYLLDCSGRNAVVGQHFDLKRRYDHLQKFSVFAHYEGAQRDPGRDGTLTRLIRGRQHWFWMIPIDERRTSVGLVCDLADFRAAKKTPEQMLDDTLADSPLMTGRMAAARRLTPVHAVGDYSYRNTRLHGPRWLLAGDAAGFIDPIFSTGVFLAIHSAEHAASALDAALRRPWVRGFRFAWYARDLNRLMDRYLRFVSAWYTEEFVDVFTAPRPPFRIPQAVNSVLGGNIHPNFSVWWRLQFFYVVLWIQKRRTIVPRHGDLKDKRRLHFHRRVKLNSLKMKNRVRIFTILAALLAFSACATRHQFAASGKGWKTATGQLRYQSTTRTVIGDLTVARGPELPIAVRFADGSVQRSPDVRLEFSKSSLALMRVLADATHLRFEGPLAHGTREYPRGAKLPGHLQLWGALIILGPPAGSNRVQRYGESLAYDLPPLR